MSEIICLHCKAAIKNKKYFNIYDELGIEVKLTTLLAKYFSLIVKQNVAELQVLCEDCIDRLITAYDVDEHGKANEAEKAPANEAHIKDASVNNETTTLPECANQQTKLAKDLTQNVREAAKNETTPSKPSGSNARTKSRRKSNLVQREELKSPPPPPLQDEIVALFEEVVADGEVVIDANESSFIIVNAASNNKTQRPDDIVVLNDTNIIYYDAQKNSANSEETAVKMVVQANDEFVLPDNDDAKETGNAAGDPLEEEEECLYEEYELKETHDQLDEYVEENEENREEANEENDNKAVELCLLFPLTDKNKEIMNIESYLNESVTSDFTTIKFNWNTECSICSTKFLKFENLLVHIYKKHKESNNCYTCPIKRCFLKLTNEKQLTQHLILRHAPLDNLQIYGRCAVCKMSFSNFAVLNKHSCARMIKRHRGMRLHCDMCEITFASMRRFVFHMQFHLEQHRPQKCLICNYTNENIENMFEHVSYDHESADLCACKVCDRIFQDAEKLSNHRHIENTDFNCKDCNKWFPSKSRLNAHIKATHAPFFTCELCKKEFIDLIAFKNHQEWHKTTTSSIHSCSNCGLVSADRVLLLEHTAEEATECFGVGIEEEITSFAYTCEFCSRDFKSKCDLKVHRASGVHHDKQYICLPCNKTFPTIKQYHPHRNHRSTKARIANIYYVYMCNVDNCEQCYTQWNSLYVHKKRHHGATKRKHSELNDGENETTETTNINEKKKDFVCQFCNKKCKTQMSLSVHIARSHNNSNVSCEYCKASFKEETALKKHVDFMHIPIECSICFKVVKNQRNYDVHQRVVHLAEKRYFCNVCQKGFFHKSDMEVHEKLHEQTYSCASCDFETNYEKSLEIHISSVHRKEFNFECPICQRKFARKHALNVHIKRHSSTQKLLCSDTLKEGGCSKVFSTEMVLKRHLKKVHNVSFQLECIEDDTCNDNDVADGDDDDVINEDDFERIASTSAAKRQRIAQVFTLNLTESNDEIQECELIGRELEDLIDDERIDTKNHEEQQNNIADDDDDDDDNKETYKYVLVKN